MSDYKFKTEPYPHQLDAFLKYRDKPAHAHLWDPRTGKSKITIDTAAYNYERGAIDGVFIVAPAGAAANWIINEVPTHCPERVSPQGLYYMTSKGGTKRHQDECRRITEHRGLSFLAMSYDGLTTDKGAAVAKAFLTGKRCLYVLDEAHRIKTPDTKRTKWVLASARHAKMLRLLTGTLVGNEPFDVYAPMMFLRPDFWRLAGFSTFTSFKTNFAEWEPRERFTGRIGPNGPVMQRFRIVAEDRETGEKKYKNLHQLAGLVSTMADRVGDVLGMPPDVFEKRYFELTKQQRRHYDELRDEFITFLDEKMVTAELAIVRAMRLQQISCGYMPTDDGEDGMLEEIPGGNPRLEALLDVVEDTKGQGIIWARFTADINRIADALAKIGETYVRYDGLVGEAQRSENVRAFQAGEARWFVGNAGAGGEGLPLYAADTVIYYSSTYKLIERLQSQDRPKKKGKTKSIGIVDIVCPGSVDDEIITALRQKQKIANVIVGDEAKNWL